MSDLSRREFLHRSALIAAGAVAADQLDLLDRLGWVRRFFTGFGTGVDGRYLTGDGRGMFVTKAQWDALLKDSYVTEGIIQAINAASPLLSLRTPRSLFTPRRYIEVVHA